MKEALSSSETSILTRTTRLTTQKTHSSFFIPAYIYNIYI
jgi:hypothetical protein